MSNSTLVLTEQQLQNFYAKIKVSDTKFCYRSMSFCHEWTASQNGDGYGLFWVSDRIKIAHRVAYALEHGTIPNGLCVLHRCDNPPCCNPEHLWLGTIADNNRDKETKKRGNHPRGDRNGTHTKPESRPRGEKHSARMKVAAARGESNGNAKLTEADIPEIFRLRAARLSQPEIGALFGVTRSIISKVLRRKTWGHVAV